LLGPRKINRVWALPGDVAKADDTLKRTIAIQWMEINGVMWLHEN
jgi:hypothetical protein